MVNNILLCSSIRCDNEYFFKILALLEFFVYNFNRVRDSPDPFAESEDMIMKKLFSLALVLCLSIGLLAGCGSKKEEPAGEAETPAAEFTESKAKLKILDTEYAKEDYAICFAKDNEELRDQVNAALAELKEDGTVDAIIKKYIEGVPHGLTFQEDVPADAPVLKMATNAAFPPYEYREGDSIVGIDAELASAIADKLGAKLVIEDMEFNSVIMAVNSGSVDFGMAGMTVTEDRLKNAIFSDTYATGVQVVIVRSDSKVTDVADLTAEGANHKVGVQQATTGDIYASDDIEAAGFGTVERYNTGADAVMALIAGRVDCVIIDNEPAKNFVEANS